MRRANRWFADRLLSPEFQLVQANDLAVVRTGLRTPRPAAISQIQPVCTSPQLDRTNKNFVVMNINHRFFASPGVRRKAHRWKMSHLHFNF
jgi:hypothetical protein